MTQRLECSFDLSQKYIPRGSGCNRPVEPRTSEPRCRELNTQQHFSAYFDKSLKEVSFKMNVAVQLGANQDKLGIIPIRYILFHYTEIQNLKLSRLLAAMISKTFIEKLYLRKLLSF